MKIQNTELEYTEADAVCLDFYLRSDYEGKEMWGKRVWNNCKKQAEGEFIARVYDCREGQSWQQRAKELWENKKARRRMRMCQHFQSPHDMSDKSVMKIKIRPDYKTADEQLAELKQMGLA